MDCLRVWGGVPLEGSVQVSGSKNAALPIMAASILADGPVTLAGVPRLLDVDTLAMLLARLGVAVRRTPVGDLCLHTVDREPTRADYDLVRRMRASFCVLGPLLARRGRAVVSLPGGCNIGTRPVDLHLGGLAALGADIRIEQGYVIAHARRLRGARMDLRGPRGPTVTGTANVMSAATLARGQTIITSAATEPEIVDLGQFLNSLGARITGLGTERIEIRGVERLHGGRYRVIPDRIEAGTLLIAAAITRGNVTVRGVRVEHLGAVLEALAVAGAGLTRGDDEITLRGPEVPRPIRIVARPYPGVPTDLQAQFAAFATSAHGQSAIRDTVFPDRFLYVDDLNRLGASVQRSGSRVVVMGPRRLSGAVVTASDLRASAALVLAALTAEGGSVIRRISHLDRGYDRLDLKLAHLGARIERASSRRLAEPVSLIARG